MIVQSRSWSGLALAVAWLFTSERATAHGEDDAQVVKLTADITAAPRDAALRALRGELHRILGHLDAARRDCEAAHALEDELASADACLARVALDEGRHGEAERHVARILARDSGDADALCLAGAARMGLGCPLEAADRFAHAARTAPHATPELHLLVAAARAAAGPEHRVEAIEGLEQAIATLGNVPALEAALRDLRLLDVAGTP